MDRKSFKTLSPRVTLRVERHGSTSDHCTKIYTGTTFKDLGKLERFIISKKIFQVTKRGQIHHQFCKLKSIVGTTFRTMSMAPRHLL